MSIFLKAVAGIMAALFLCGAARAQTCEMVFADGPRTISFTPAEIRSGSEVRDSIILRVRNLTDEDCTFQIGTNLAATFNPDTFPETRISGPSGPVRLAELRSLSTDSGVGYAVREVIGANAEKAFRFDFAVQSGWDIAAGAYSANLVFSLIENSGTRILDTQTIDLALRIPNATDIKLVGNTARLDMGELSLQSPTVSPPFGVRVFSNAPYQISVVSENAGILRHVQDLDEIEYEFALSGRPVPLREGQYTFGGLSQTAATGMVMPIRVVVAPQPEKHAGDYGDRITLTVTAN